MNATETARGIIAGLVQAGVGHVVVCPGSRSGPLALAVAQAEAAGKLRAHVRLDERGAGFYALGLARAALLASGTRAPLVALVVTSGTAVANLHPAVLEAHHSRIPLILLTADRPHEMRGVGASQTADQVGLFGSAVRFSADVPADAPLGSVIPRAAAAAVGNWVLPPVGLADSGREPFSPASHPLSVLAGLGWEERAAFGPVHLNVALRDPLLDPQAGEWHWPGDEAVGSERLGAGRPAGPVPARGSVVPTPVEVGAGSVVVAGDAGRGAALFALAGNLPLFAEPSSGVRCEDLAVGPYRAMLAGELGQRIKQAVVFGHPTLSRPVSHLLARADVEVIVVDRSARWTDVAANASAVVPAALAMVKETERAEVAAWTAAWREAGRAAQDALLAHLAGQMSSEGACERVWRAHLADWAGGLGEGDELGEGDGAGEGSGLSEGSDLPEVGRPLEARSGSYLVIGASAGIRYFDLLAGAQCGEVAGGEVGGAGQGGSSLAARVLASRSVVANRGLAGIDGTIATAAGLGAALGCGVRCVVGDLTFLHDAGSLLRGAHEADVDLDVIVLNDVGGAIFAGLEAGDGRVGEHYERFWGTPQDVDIEALATAYKCGYVRVETLAELDAALAASPRGRRVVEVACAGRDARRAGQELSRVAAQAAQAALAAARGV
ncbi:MAG: thiamine pyrophosphate-binding protein [Buchananella hordeovulneris]|nr:thiamine pyrophosphate-binding protein [Buchananella hordeovulneris]